MYEWQGGAATQYYQGPTGPLALRRTGHGSDDGVFYMLSDHLGSTSILVDQAGTVQSQQYYHPFGDNRNGPFSTLTTKRFTGQYHEAALGLYFYGARWYDPLLGRFTQADTLIPDPAAPQAFNRYAYTLNNPLRYTDPSGHRYEPCGPGGADCGGGGGGGGGNGGGGHGGGGGGHGGGGGGKGSHPHQGYKWSWSAPPGYEDWYASAKYGGCFKCHAVHFSHRTALTNQELANVDERMRRLYYIAVKDSAMSGIILLSLLEGMPTGEAAIDEAEAALAAEDSAMLAEDSIAAFEESLVAEGEMIVYRGLNPDHPQLRTYLETGVVEPWGGDATLYDHVWGNTRSNFTSWTTDIEVAKFFAGEDGTILSVDLNKISNKWYPSYQWSIYDESEITIEGNITGAQTIFP